MITPVDGRGILYPTRLPTFHRVPASPDLAAFVRWFWIPRWRLPPGRVSRQEVLPFPASNLVVEPEGVSLSGPTTRVSHRDLRGTGWAVGALLRPAGIAALGIEPGGIRDAEVPFDAPELQRAVSSAMQNPDETQSPGATQGPDELQSPDEEAARGSAVDAYGWWLFDRAARPDERALLANALEDTVSADREIVRVEQLAERLGISIRRVQRLAQRYIGVPPLAVIRRYRLQEALERLREDPESNIARVAAELGYADHAHLAADFRRVMGLTPNSYRESSRLPSQAPE